MRTKSMVSVLRVAPVMDTLCPRGEAASPESSLRQMSPLHLASTVSLNGKWQDARLPVASMPPARPPARLPARPPAELWPSALGRRPCVLAADRGSCGRRSAIRPPGCQLARSRARAVACSVAPAAPRRPCAERCCLQTGWAVGPGAEATAAEPLPEAKPGSVFGVLATAEDARLLGWVALSISLRRRARRHTSMEACTVWTPFPEPLRSCGPLA